MTLNEQHLSEANLTAFLDGMMWPEAARQAEAHIEVYATCAAVIADGRRLSAEMRQWTIEEAPSRLTENVLAQVPKTVLQKKGSSKARGSAKKDQAQEASG